MWAVKAFGLGAFAVGVLGYAAAAALAVAAQAGGRSVDIGLGPFLIVAVLTHRSETAITFGAGIVALAALGGLANLAAAALVKRRSRRPVDRVD
jgi:hypothetical protein